MGKKSNIGIVGAGVAGIQLGLFLQKHNIPVTIYTEKTADQIANGRLLNTVAHHHHTRERERELGVNHWESPEYGYFCHNHFIGGDHPLRFRGDFISPSNAVDYRIYLPRLMRDFEERGGQIEIVTLQQEDIERLSEEHDLIVVAGGRGGFSNLFSRIKEHSPFDKPQRHLSAGLYEGIEYSNPRGTGVNTSPGHGDLLEIPIYSFKGHVTALLFENVPGGDLDILSAIRYDENPDLYNQIVLEKLQKHYPATYERVNPEKFGLTGPLDLLQGAVTPTIRESYVQLPNGKFAIAVGDAHMTVDPIVGQGANAASYSAWILGEAILEDYEYDKRFCEKVAQRRWEYLSSVSKWVNFMIAPAPASHLVELSIAMANNKEIADDFTNNFNDPVRQWDILATPARTKQYIKEFSIVKESV